MVDANYEGEMSVVVMEHQDGTEKYYELDTVIPMDGKEFALLIEVVKDERCGEGCGCHPAPSEPEAIIARIDREDDEEVYVAPTEEEFAKVLALYEELFSEEESQ